MLPVAADPRWWSVSDVISLLLRWLLLLGGKSAEPLNILHCFCKKEGALGVIVFVCQMISGKQMKIFLLGMCIMMMDKHVPVHRFLRSLGELWMWPLLFCLVDPWCQHRKSSKKFLTRPWLIFYGLFTFRLSISTWRKIGSRAKVSFFAQSFVLCTLYLSRS